MRADFINQGYRWFKVHIFISWQLHFGCHHAPETIPIKINDNRTVSGSAFFLNI